MITAFDIYLLGLLYDSKETLESFFVFLIPLFVLSGAGYGFFKIGEEELFDKPSSLTTVCRNTCAVAITLVVVVAILKAVAPSKQTVIAMVTVPPVISNEKVQELPSNVLDFVNGWLKEYTPKTPVKENSF